MELFITPVFVVSLCYAVLLVSFASYLLWRHRRAVAARWLAAFCLTFSLMFNAWNVLAIVHPLRVEQSVIFWAFFFGQGSLLVYALTLQQFAYAFRGNPYPREGRVMLVLVGSLAVLVLVLFIPVRLGNVGLFGVLAQIGYLSSIMLSIWTLVVMARKTVRFSRDAQALGTAKAEGIERWSIWQHLRHPQGRAARACRVLLGVLCLPIFITILGALMWGLSLNAEIIRPLWVTCVFLFVYSIIVAYTTYTPEATTVQVKLVATVLATVLLLLALVSTVLYDPYADMRQQGAVTAAPHTLRFTPDAQGGYTVARQPFDPAQTPIRPAGELLSLGYDEEERVPIGFAFPFYGAMQDTMYVDANGVIRLGTDEKGFFTAFYSPSDFLRKAPKVAPLFVDFIRGGGSVYVEHAPDHVAVIWHEMNIAGINPRDRYTMRATLYRTGVIAFDYATPAGQLLAGTPEALVGRGLVPGGDQAQAQSWHLVNEQATGEPGAALVELYPEPVLRYSHQVGMKLLALLLAATLFCLLVLPLLFRASLLRPLSRLLDGLQAVEQGKLDTSVNIPTHDEVGQLAQHFNIMTHALRKAEHQLRDYAATLEQKVDVRTAALTQSLEELKAAQARLIQAEKMASLGALTAGIAHEIKNPLNFVNNFAELSSDLVDELQEELDALNGQLGVEQGSELAGILEDLRLNTQKINQHGKRADGIVQAMLLHSRGTEGERRAVDLNALVEEYINLAYHGKRAQMPDFNVEIEEKMGSNVGQVELVPQDIGRVLLNLLGNAFDAVAEKAASASEPYVPTVLVSTRRIDEQVEIRVADNGPGIPDNVRDKIFEPFFTTKPTGSGTGLGLSLSYDIITQGHGGALSVVSEEGAGATFVVQLPETIAG